LLRKKYYFAKDIQEVIDEKKLLPFPGIVDLLISEISPHGVK
jgi:hypothetical protein